ncbi:hypothetical protein Lser_V15G01506 [Lactuca serriola]
MIPFLSNGGNRGNASSTLPPPPPVTLPKSCFLQVEKYEITQALLACKHQDGKFVCVHVLEMKSYIDRLDMLGVVFPKDLAIELVLVSLPESYSRFIKDYYMSDHDITLIDLTHMLIVVEAEMLKSTIQAKVFEGSVSKISIDNSDNGGPEHISLPNGKGWAKVKQFDRMVKRKVSYEIGHWLQSYPNYLKGLRDGKVKLYDSTSGSKRKK